MQRKMGCIVIEFIDISALDLPLEWLQIPQEDHRKYGFGGLKKIARRSCKAACQAAGIPRWIETKETLNGWAMRRLT